MFLTQIDVTFHGVAYLLTVSTIESETLCLEVEQKSDCSRWRGDFTSRYIEDITAKTGNFKKFPVFVKMLLSALKQASDSVFVDLLTYQDLEVLKSRKAGNQAPPPRTQAPNNKRYLIMTYAAEFDRVHYPLPLLYEENPDPQHLKRVISQLRAEVEALQSEAGNRRGSEASAELRRLREENTGLKHQLKQMERVGSPGAGQDQSADARELSRDLKTARKERDLLQARLEAAEAELERERGVHRRELRRRAKEQQELIEELGRCKEVIRELKMRVRQLTEDTEMRDRRLASADRMRSVYARGAGEPSGSARPGSRTSSAGRGTSPSYGAPTRGADSRSHSRGRPTSSAERSRPNSAPVVARPRFDPTEYVRQRKEREANHGGRRSNAPTPPRSGQSSRAPSVAGSRPESAERLPALRNPSPGSSRPNSGERFRHGGSASTGPPGYSGAGGSRGAADRAGSRLPDSYGAQRSRGASPSGRVTNAWAEPAPGSGGAGWSKFPGGGGGAGGGNRFAGNSPRSMSPGRALMEVKQKLSTFVSGRPPGTAADDASSAQGDHVSQSSKSQVFEDASAEIADIDSRLHALQSFLRMAKSSSTSTTTTTTAQA
ncbi:hypothetical protein VOLCADRAFT_84510 [Volvox carteri f. nagariensis]|uniref:Coiled-coil domain-containing protein 61 n=1 Tax=Volvox carteri f. nagariensis TaxID=3068 RepID=D8UIW0_VOLCA|nr:uncharacterized protein VOLCADRAFT_84510 [Volvox carteri f. nagariensis]EFJ40344.1 hypothetical protein VOLCADRAFT_84510 [Volvox carteri f. nagariensis]|eukprot:XP_002958607.1 hypothetical protein VOLCADRAFT_84510 [Volvox carteri f. nagariensis]